MPCVYKNTASFILAVVEYLRFYSEGIRARRENIGKKYTRKIKKWQGPCGVLIGFCFVGILYTQLVNELDDIRSWEILFLFTIFIFTLLLIDRFILTILRQNVYFFPKNLQNFVNLLDLLIIFIRLQGANWICPPLLQSSAVEGDGSSTAPCSYWLI